MLGTLTDDQIDYILRSQIIGRIGCYDGKEVYIVPVTYVYDQGYIYAIPKKDIKFM